MALQLAECVHSWHAAGCVHYEICPATVVRSSANTIRLTKLGSIDRYPACKAPEQLENLFIQSSAYTAAVDVWALGVTLLHAWTGRQPCAGQHEAQIMQRMRAGEAGVLRDLGHSEMRPDLQVRRMHARHAYAALPEAWFQHQRDCAFMRAPCMPEAGCLPYLLPGRCAALNF